MAKTITIDDVQTVMGKAQASASCPCCGAAAWSLVEQASVVPGITAFAADGSFSIPPPNLPLVILVCNSCGFVRAHSRVFFEGVLAGTTTPRRL